MKQDQLKLISWTSIHEKFEINIPMKVELTWRLQLQIFETPPGKMHINWHRHDI